jgi:uncharacterized protein (TIGR01777 family)
MTYLITGATGFVGTKLVNRLLANGDSVNFLARKRPKHFDSRAAFHPWDPSKEAPLSSVPRVDAVINLAGEPIAQRWTAEVKKRICDSRILGTRNLVDAIGKLKYRPRVLVSASAVGFYGDRGSEVLTEASLPGGDFLAKVCVDWESEALRAREFGLQVMPIRIATVLGKEGGAFPLMARPFRLGLGAKFGDGEQWMSWIHVDDLCRLIEFAASWQGESQALNGSSPEPVTSADFTAALGHALHRPAFLAAPKFAMKLALGEMSDFLFDSLRVVPEAPLQLGFQFRYATLREALESVVS